eukprot:TRINITY_DN5900_c5_g1_i1.p1 TRINITY_DN5900_c5_g1~~TRINITY_DN5900_c5_g1_i1.p1  ORF type:complete len:928 (+),score=275.63 TRINITY_DN5900_c5_g1_i1:326-2785(+)
MPAPPGPHTTRHQRQRSTDLGRVSPMLLPPSPPLGVTVSPERSPAISPRDDGNMRRASSETFVPRSPSARSDPDAGTGSCVASPAAPLMYSITDCDLDSDARSPALRGADAAAVPVLAANGRASSDDVVVELAGPTPASPIITDQSDVVQVMYRVVWPSGVRCRVRRAPPADDDFGGQILEVDHEFGALEPAKDGWVQKGADQWVPLWSDGRAVVTPISQPPHVTMLGHIGDWLGSALRIVLFVVFVWLVLGVLLDLNLTCGAGVLDNSTNVTNATVGAPAFSPDDLSDDIKKCGLGQGVPSTSSSGNIPTYAVGAFCVLGAVHYGVTMLFREMEWSEHPILLCTLPFLHLFFILDLVYQAAVGMTMCVYGLLSRPFTCCDAGDTDGLESALELADVAPLLADTTRGVLAVTRLAGFKRYSIGFGYCLGYHPDDIRLYEGVPLREAICGVVRKCPDLFPKPETEGVQEAPVPSSEPVDCAPPIGSPRPRKTCCQRFIAGMKETPALSGCFWLGMPCLLYMLVQYGVMHCMVTERWEFVGGLLWAYLGPYTGEAIIIYQRARGLIVANMDSETVTAMDVQNQFLFEWCVVAIIGHILMTAFFLCVARADIALLMGKARKFLRKYTERYEAGDHTTVCGSAGFGKRLANLCRIMLMPSLLGATLGFKVIFILSFTPAVSQWLEKLIWASLEKDSRSACGRAAVVAGCAALCSFLDIVDDLPNNLALYWAAVQVVEDNSPAARSKPFFVAQDAACDDFLTGASVAMQWMVLVVLSYFLVKPGLCAILVASASHLPKEPYHGETCASESNAPTAPHAVVTTPA